MSAETDDGSFIEMLPINQTILEQHIVPEMDQLYASPLFLRLLIE